MISNQILQNTIAGMKNISHVELWILDMEGRVVASTQELSARTLEECRLAAADFVSSPADVQSFSGYRFFKVFDGESLEYILMGKGEEDFGLTLGKLMVFQLENLLVAYKERFDRDNFIKNLLLDNLLLVDIFSRAKKLRIPEQSDRLVLLIEGVSPEGNTPLEQTRDFFGEASGDFVTAVDEKSVVVVKNLEGEGELRQLEKDCNSFLNRLASSGFTDLRVAFGTMVNDLREVSRSYKEARMAMDVGKIFFENRRSITYSELGIGRLIYQLPLPLCRMFIQEIFKKKNPEDFDKEILATVYKFFENSLNVSETSRQLFIHRNTLVYRLDKLEKSTGLDLRNFEDAITFKIALMVVNYMKYMEEL